MRRASELLQMPLVHVEVEERRVAEEAVVVGAEVLRRLRITVATMMAVMDRMVSLGLQEAEVVLHPVRVVEEPLVELRVPSQWTNLL